MASVSSSAGVTPDPYPLRRAATLARVLGTFSIVARRRPVDLVAPGFCSVEEAGPGHWPLPQPAPYAAVTAELATTSEAALALTSGDTGLVCRLADGVLSLRVEAGGRTTHHRSRRFGAVSERPEALALTLTGTHLTGLVRERGRWVARARYDLGERLRHPRRGLVAAGLEVAVDGGGRARSAPAPSDSSACATSGWSPRPTARRSATATGCC